MSFFLFGPRGTGKSTWLRANFPNALVVDLLDEAEYQACLADPARFQRTVNAAEPGSWVVVDEVQRIPALLNEVHRQIESRQMQFVLCGSSARKLKHSGTNLLAGRATNRRMHAFVPEELGEEFDLDRVLRCGSLPVVWRASDREEALAAYATMYLREEVQAEALVRNLPGFARFLPIAALVHGSTVNISAIARDAGVARTTVSGYIEVLEDTLMAYRLPAFEARLRVRERKHPKLYWIDPGLPRALQRRRGDPSREELGHLFEGWVAGLLRAHGDYRDLFDDWGYWAPTRASTVEVDFVLRRRDSLVAIETKLAGTITERSFRGLRAMGELPGIKRRILLVHDGPLQRTQDGIEIIPVRAFLDVLQAGSLWGDAGDAEP